MHIKRFLAWIGVKERLDSKISAAPFVNEGEIWWASLGENIGFEINGKSRDFTRPVIIFKKLTHNFYLVVPVSTKIKTGTWYISFKQKGIEMMACLSQVRSIDYRRLHPKLGELDAEDFKNVKNGFLELYS